MSIDPNKLKFIKSQADFGASVSAQSVQLLLTEIDELRAVLAQEAGHVEEPIGMAEPMAWLYKNTNMGNELSLQKLDHFYRPYTPKEEHDYVKGIALYTSPPAPAAVVLPERKPVQIGLLSESNTHNQGWNDCLDKVKELNQ